MSAVLILSCGGTYDKSKFTKDGKFVCGDPAATKLIAEADVDVDEVTVESLMRKDSLDMDDADRAALVTAITDASQARIVVVHGTDTLVQSAQTVAQANIAKTVVFVGAMRPAIFTGSDAAFNLGYALAQVQLRETGVWVAMHGRCWRHDQVKKDTQIYRFVDV